MTNDALQNSRGRTIFSVEGAVTIEYLYEKNEVRVFLKFIFIIVYI